MSGRGGGTGHRPDTGKDSRQELWGRVLAISGHTLVLFDDGHTRQATVTSAEGVEPGDLVRVEGGAVVWRAAGPGQWPAPEGHPAHHLGGLTGGRLRTLRQRAELLRKTRAFFHGEGFMEVETPLIVPSAGTETHLDPVAVRLSPTPGAPAEQAWLITSPEYAMKQLLAAGAGPIYQLGRVFRDGERGANHRPEFTMLEWYRPWVVDGYASLFSDCERLVGALTGGASTLRWGGRTLSIRPPWPRLTFFDALTERAGLVAPRRLDPDAWMRALVERVEPTLGREHPEFLTEWPIEMASLARRSSADPDVAERFELYVGNLELANAFAELTDGAEQRARCLADNAERRALGRPEMPLDPNFLAALEVGLPDSAGIALGFDRLVMLLTDSPDIDAVSAL